jgi:hypothetical protein
VRALGLIVAIGAALAFVHPAQAQTTTEPSAEFYELTDRGLEHFSAERYEAALVAFDEALTLSNDGADATSVAFNAAACAFALGRFDDAERRFLAVAARPEGTPLATLNAGFAALYGGRPEAAQRHLDAVPRSAEFATRRAELELGIARARRERTPTPPPRAAQAPRYPLPPSGVALYASLSGGYDNNALQSGKASASDESPLAPQTGSAFMAFLGELSHTWRLGTRTALTPYYSGDFLALTDSSVRELSLQGHELGVRGTLAPSTTTAIRVTAAGSYLVSGLDALEPFAWELALGSRLELRHGEHFRTRFDVWARPTFGLSGNDALDGGRYDASGSERYRTERFDLTVDARLRYLRAGTQRLALDPSAVAVCDPDCTEYSIPGSYVAPSLGLEAGFEVVERLRLSAGARGELRRYLEPAVITGFPETERLRRDARLRVRGGAELELDEAGTFRVSADYTFTTNHSNIAYDPDDPEHAFDYDDRNFDQHVVELGLAVMF